MGLTAALIARGVMAVATGAVAAIAAFELDDWLGDWVGSLWLLGPFAAAFIAGIAWGGGATGKRGAILGAVVGAAVVLVPSGGYLLYVEAVGRDLGAEVSDLDLPRLWLAFFPVAMVFGSLGAPMGSAVRTSLQQRLRS